MEDIERYGDYNEVDEAPGGSKNPVVTVLKVLVIAICLLVVGVVLFRVALFNYYPKSIKNIYFDDELTEYYNSTGGDIGAVTQTLRAPYDDPDFASFFADNLIIIEDVGQLQLSIRYNSSVFDSIEKEYGVRIDADADDPFTFELERVPFEDGGEAYKIGELEHVSSQDLLMYTYYKLVFDDVSFPDGDTPDWIRIKITINGLPDAAPYYILIYENTDEYSSLGEYKLSGKEKPNA